MFSPSLLQTPSTSRRQAVDLAKELGCVTSDLTDDEKMVACLRASPVHTMNAAQTKVQLKNSLLDSNRESPGVSPVPCVSVLQLLAVSGPFQSWSPVRQSVSLSSFHRVDLLLGTSEHDGLISRARRIKVRDHSQNTALLIVIYLQCTANFRDLNGQLINRSQVHVLYSDI